MTAVVRVKRHLDEEPSEALILNCKRRKTNQENEDDQLELSCALLKFAGTVNKDENILVHLKKQSVPDLKVLKDQYKKHAVNLSEKLRVEVKNISRNNRYRIVNYLRSQSLEDETNVVDKSETDITIVDLETDFNQNTSSLGNQNESTSNQQFVYDLYYTNSDDFGEAEIDDYVSIHPLNDPLLVGSSRDNGLKMCDSDNESEDSNNENNWRNDYPDESDMDSVNEDDMVEAIKKVDFGDDLLSSDDGEEGFVYSVDSEEAAFEEDIDESDVHRYGERYARFKARNKPIVATGLDHDFYYGDIDEEEYYY